MPESFLHPALEVLGIGCRRLSNRQDPQAPVVHMNLVLTHRAGVGDRPERPGEVGLAEGDVAAHLTPT